MENINVNTDKMYESNQNMDILICEIKEIFDDTFDTLNNMITKKGIWQGESANRYMQDILLDKKNYSDFIISLSKYSAFLHNYANDLNSLIGGIRK